MALSDYSYVPKARIIELAAIVLAVAMLIGYVTSSALTVREALPNTLGVGRDTYIIYDGGSRALFTGVVPEVVMKLATQIKGVKAASPEVLTPAYINGDTAAFVRGVDLDSFLQVTELSLTEGRWFNTNSSSEAVIGESLAKKAGIEVGDVILLEGAVSGRTAAVRVVGIASTSLPFSDEVLVPLETGRALRGLGGEAVSIIRVKVSDPEAGRVLEERFSGNMTSGGWDLASLPAWVLKFIASGRLKAGPGSAVLRDYIGVYGLSKSVVAALTTLITIIGASIVYVMGRTYVSGISYEVSTLLALGARRNAVLKDLYLKTLPYVLIAASSGVVASVLLLNAAGAEVILHVVSPVVDVLTYLLEIAALTLAVLVAIRNGVAKVRLDEAG